MNRLKTIILPLAAALTSLLPACAQNKTEKAMPQNSAHKVLVAYFSATGNTRRAAEDLAKAMGGDLYEITPETPYTVEDLDWRDSSSRSTLEMKDLSSRPAIKSGKLDVADYDVIFVGFPIWWYTAPTIVNTFLESYDFSGKTMIPFATSGGSTIDKSNADLKAAYPKLDWKPGRLLNSTSYSQLADWKKQLGI